MNVAMTTDQAIELADEWIRGVTFHHGSEGWRIACKLLADEVRRLRRGESICTKCGLRQDAEPQIVGDF